MLAYRTSNEIVEIVPDDKNSVSTQELEISHHGRTVKRNIHVVKYTIKEYKRYFSEHDKKDGDDLAEFLGHGIMAAVEPDAGEYFIYICKDIFEKLDPKYRTFILMHEMYHIYHDLDKNNPFYFELEDKKLEFNHRYKHIFYEVVNKHNFKEEFLESIWSECIPDLYALSKMNTFIDYDYIYKEFVCKCNYVRKYWCTPALAFKDLRYVKRMFKFRAEVMTEIMKRHKEDFVK